MTVGLLGFQGAIQDHIRHLDRLDMDHVFVKDPKTLDRVDAMILPGGESTVMKKYLDQFDLTARLSRKIGEGIPVWGICAGAILLARMVDERPGTLGCMDVHVERNAYGRQAQSTIKKIDVPELARTRFPAVFIRAPRVLHRDPHVTVLAKAHADPVFLKQDRMMITTFHPELTDDSVFHDYFRTLRVQ